MTSRTRHLTIALMVATVATVAAGPAQSAVRPAADHRFGRSVILTPMPLDGRTARLSSAQQPLPVLPRSAAGRTRGVRVDAEPESGAPEPDRDGMVPLLAFSGIGALLVLLVTLLVMGHTPRRGPAA